MLTIAVVAVGSFFGFLGFMGWFASRLPDLAATEGPTYVESRQLSLTAKHMPTTVNTDIAGDPQNPTLLDATGPK